MLPPWASGGEVDEGGFRSQFKVDRQSRGFLELAVALIRISHRLSTAASDTGMFTALRSVARG